MERKMFFSEKIGRDLVYKDGLDWFYNLDLPGHN